MLDCLFHFMHNKWADGSSKGPTDKEGFVESSNLFALGHGGLSKAALTCAKLNVGGRGAERS